MDRSDYLILRSSLAAAAWSMINNSLSLLVLLLISICSLSTRGVEAVRCFECETLTEDCGDVDNYCQADLCVVSRSTDATGNVGFRSVTKNCQPPYGLETEGCRRIVNDIVVTVECRCRSVDYCNVIELLQNSTIHVPASSTTPTSTMTTTTPVQTETKIIIRPITSSTTTTKPNVDSSSNKRTTVLPVIVTGSKTDQSALKSRGESSLNRPPKLDLLLAMMILVLAFLPYS